MRRVLVTGASAPLGRRLLERLRAHADVEQAVGVERSSTAGRLEGVEQIVFSADHRELNHVLSEREIDTVIHCSLAPDRTGQYAYPCEARVIDTMRLGAAIAHEGSPVRCWVVASSSDVYPVDSHAPLLRREDAALDPREGTIAESLIEAEGYARGVAERCPHLNVAILRLQQIVGEGVRSPIASLLGQPVLPALIGYDAPLQLLALDDAVRALIHAAELELAGVYNVASTGLLRYSEVRELIGRRALPVLPIGAGALSPLARLARIPHVPEGMLGPMLYGHAVDTAKIAASGFHPYHDQSSCLEALAGR